ncbi:hypothetical protein D3C80_1941290 [compost metagenome]
MTKSGQTDPVVKNIDSYNLAFDSEHMRPIYCTKKQVHRPERLGCTVYLPVRQPFDGRPFMMPMPATREIAATRPGGQTQQAFAEDNGRQVAE